MRILFLDQFSSLGGAQQCLRDLMPGVIERGWGAHVALPGVGPLAAQLSAMGIAVHELPLASFTNGRKSAGDMLRFAYDTPRLAASIRRLIDGHGIDLVYVNGPRLLPAAALASRRFLFHSHSRLSAAYASFLAGISLRARRAGAIASSRFVADPLVRYLGFGRLRVIYNGVPDHGPVRPPPNRAPVIGIIGRIAPEKGHVDFVRAARMLPDYRWVICGDGLHSGSEYMDEVRRQARDLPVEFRGWQEDIGPVMRELDILAVPSMALDATPRVILEAFSAGVCVVAYPAGGIPELIEHGSTGILTDSLVHAIRGLATEPEQMRVIRENARRVYEQRFSIGRFRDEVLSAIEDFALR